MTVNKKKKNKILNKEIQTEITKIFLGIIIASLITLSGFSFSKIFNSFNELELFFEESKKNADNECEKTEKDIKFLNLTSKISVNPSKRYEKFFTPQNKFILKKDIIPDENTCHLLHTLTSENITEIINELAEVRPYIMYDSSFLTLDFRKRYEDKLNLEKKYWEEIDSYIEIKTHTKKNSIDEEKAWQTVRLKIEDKMQENANIKIYLENIQEDYSKYKKQRVDNSQNWKQKLKQKKLVLLFSVIGIIFSMIAISVIVFLIYKWNIQASCRSKSDK